MKSLSGPPTPLQLHWYVGPHCGPGGNGRPSALVDGTSSVAPKTTARPAAIANTAFPERIRCFIINLLKFVRAILNQQLTEQQCTFNQPDLPLSLTGTMQISAPSNSPWRRPNVQSAKNSYCVAKDFCSQEIFSCATALWKSMKTGAACWREMSEIVVFGCSRCFLCKLLNYSLVLETGFMDNEFFLIAVSG